MRKKQFLAAILLAVGFCFVSGVGSLVVFAEGFSIGKALSMPTTVETVRAPGIEAILAKRGKYVARQTFLVIPIEGVLSIFWTFLDMYPDAEIPEEFSLILPSEINNVDKMKKAGGRRIKREFVMPDDLIVSLLLTMAYQQDYDIEYVTNSYMILVKSVYEEELKE